MKKYLFLFMCCSVMMNGASQEAGAGENKIYVYNQKNTPSGLENYLFSTYYFDSKKVYNLRNMLMCSAGGEILSMKINPSGTTFAVIADKGKKKVVTVYDLWKSDKKIHEFKDINNPSAVCYTMDAREIIVASDGNALFYDARTFEPTDTIKLSFNPIKMTVSNNGYFLAATDGEKSGVWNMEKKSLRKEFDNGIGINDIAFSGDNSEFAVLADDGLLSVYDTRNFFIKQSYDALGISSKMSFHPDGKYATVVSGDNRIAVVNLMDDEEREYVDDAKGGIKNAFFVKDNKKRVFLVYNTTDNITYKLMSELAPNYSKLLAEELKERMNDWMKMMPGETLEEYKLRVNEETREKQMRLFEQEIATRMADNLVQMSEVTLGSYNMEENLLAVNFDKMPTIYLSVPSEEINDFKDPGNLEFRNAKYGLNNKDKFELIYADVYNKVSGKTYVFDNLDRKSLEYLSADENFVPLELVQQSNMEEIRLEEIKEKIVNIAKEKKTISDHTKISVDAKVISDVDASGNSIMNYLIKFGYEVEKGFSEKEDFAPGKYKTEDSGAAMSMLEIIRTAFLEDFSQYVKPGKKLVVKINGMADALPISGVIKYDGCYGDFSNEPVYKNGELGNVSVNAKEGITQNDQLAFMRAMGVKEFIDKNIGVFGKMDTDYSYYIELLNEKGGEFRRISVEFLFVDAF